MNKDLRDLITDKEYHYMENYICSNADYKGIRTKLENPIREILSVWAENKSMLLSRLFKDSLIVKKKFTYAPGETEIEDAIIKTLYINPEVDNFITKFKKAVKQYFFGDLNIWTFDSETRDNAFSILSLMDNKTLVENKYTGVDVKILSSVTGKVVKIARGSKAIKAIKKVADALNFSGKDEGYEAFRLAHSLCLNQKKLEGELCLSIHPLDYMTMSDNANGWSSCMSWVNEGEYRAGTVEMMNSPMVIVAYLAGDKIYHGEENAEDFVWNSKKWRELFVINEDIITGVKSYPYTNKNISEAALSFIKELAAAAGLKYEKKSFIWKEYGEECEDGLVIKPKCNTMYNDFQSSFSRVASLSAAARKSKKEISFNYSGPRQCMVSGEVGSGYLFDGNTDGLIRTDLSKACRCDSCGELWNPEDTYTVDGERICSCCYDNDTEFDVLTNEPHFYSNMFRLLIGTGKVVSGKKMYCSNFPTAYLYQDYVVDESWLIENGYVCDSKAIYTDSETIIINYDAMTPKFISALGYSEEVFLLEATERRNELGYYM